MTITENGGARLTAGNPSLRWDEVSILLEIELPNALFEKPRLEARISIPETVAVQHPITTEVVENVQEAIETATGLSFHISVIKEEQEEK